MAQPSHQLPPGYDKSQFYNPDIQSVEEPMRTLLEKYSRIPDGNIVDHVNEVRKRAWAVFPYPCIGVFRFLDLEIGRFSIYPEILERVKSGEKFLDIGCALAQELRQLVKPLRSMGETQAEQLIPLVKVYDGAPSENLYGSDLRVDLTNVGYDLFNDRNSLKTPFIEADIFNDNSPLVTNFTGQFSIINAMSFFHLFNYEAQKVVAKRIVSLLRPHPGSLVIGRHVGCEIPGEGSGGNMLGYCHDEKTWKEFWEVIGKETGTNWKVDAERESWGVTNSPGIAQLNRIFKLRFVVRRE